MDISPSKDYASATAVSRSTEAKELLLRLYHRRVCGRSIISILHPVEQKEWREHNRYLYPLAMISCADVTARLTRAETIKMAVVLIKSESKKGLVLPLRVRCHSKTNLYATLEYMTF